MKLTNGTTIHNTDCFSVVINTALLMYSSGIWGLMEIKLAPDNPNIILSFKSRVTEVAAPIFQVRPA